MEQWEQEAINAAAEMKDSAADSVRMGPPATLAGAKAEDGLSSSTLLILAALAVGIWYMTQKR